MTNIPTELLRTLLAVVDLRSFTKAARALGVTQPAVSAQIKRLQSLLGFDLFDKSAPGVSVTEKGKRIVAICPMVKAYVEKHHDFDDWSVVWTLTLRDDTQVRGYPCKTSACEARRK